jgi:hypothetical protein
MAAHAFPAAGVEPDALATPWYAVVDPGLEQGKAAGRPGTLS